MGNTLFRILGGFVAVLGFTISADATTLTFDELHFPNDQMHLPTSYMGLTWNNWDVCDTNLWHWGPAVSGENTIFNLGSPTTVTGSNFNFYGAYIAGAYKDGLNVDVSGKRDGNEIYHTTMSTTAHNLIWFDFNFLNIDELSFSAFGGTPVEPDFEDVNWFHMDNFTYSTVPEPSTIVLLAIGIMGVLGGRTISKRVKA